MEVSSEEVAAHVLVSRLVLTEDFAWKSGGSAGIYQKCSPCLLDSASLIYCGMYCSQDITLEQDGKGTL